MARNGVIEIEKKDSVEAVAIKWGYVTVTEKSVDILVDQAIVLNADEGLIEIRGKSYPENTFEFYAPMMDWVREYFETSAQDVTTVNLEITYFNSSSSKLFFDFFDLCYHIKTI